MKDLSGQHAVVTGGGSGIGAAVADALSAAGASVTLIGRNEARLRATGGSRMHWQVADVTDRIQVGTALEAAAAANGPISILVNNAGAADAAPFSKMDHEHWHRMIAVNLDGVFHCTRAVIEGMAAAKTGRVVNVASTAGLRGYAYVAAYCAAKHGVIGLTRALALEYATRGITVNAVCPGYTNTDIVEKSIDRICSATGRSREEALAELVKANPQGRLIEPHEVAATVLWLCRQESMTGQAIAIAGGEVM